MKTRKYIDCHKCEYYYVTWDNNFPHGCRKINFKSREFPSAVVLKNSGTPCLMFKSKLRNKTKKND